MTDFRRIFDDIKDFIEASYPKYLEAFDLDKPFITTEFLDFDRFKNDFCMFIEIDRVNFAASPYADDCGKIARIFCDIFLVFRGGTVAKIDADLKDASSALYQMFRNEEIDEAENATIREIDFFRYVEGHRAIVASKSTMELEVVYH